MTKETGSAIMGLAWEEKGLAQPLALVWLEANTKRGKVKKAKKTRKDREKFK